MGNINGGEGNVTETNKKKKTTTVIYGIHQGFLCVNHWHGNNYAIVIAFFFLLCES